MTLFRRFWKSEHGATAIEYGLIASLLSIAIVGSASAMGVDLMAIYDDVADQVASALGGD